MVILRGTGNDEPKSNAYKKLEQRQGASPDILILRPCRAAEMGFRLGPELRRRPEEKRHNEEVLICRHDMRRWEQECQFEYLAYQGAFSKLLIGLNKERSRENGFVCLKSQRET